MTAIVFDLGGVLIDWNPRHLYRKIFADPAEMERFLSEVCHGAWNVEQDAGRPWDEAIAEATARAPHYAAEIAAFRGRWPEMLAGPIAGTVAILEELRASGRPLYALSNWSAETFPIAQDLYPFLGWFRDIVVSGQEKIVKPDARIFEIMIRRGGLDPRRTVFVDDSAANVAAAAKLGFDALRFVSPEALRRDLAARGLI
ncbi:MAG: HAD family phosphatase [Alphaproteobacteria bacterium]|nr:HAD family phosphatase [Alphaproteobacteria bacterium]